MPIEGFDASQDTQTYTITAALGLYPSIHLNTTKAYAYAYVPIVFLNMTTAPVRQSPKTLIEPRCCTACETKI